MSTFKKGDRVRYTGKHSIYTASHIGYVGTVEDSGLYQTSEGTQLSKVLWDIPAPGSTPFVANLELVYVPTKDEVDAALSVLKAAGTVEFKPHKPPFRARDVKVNDTYTAIVTADGVIIGCQKFKLDEMRNIIFHLNNAVESAIAYKGES